MPPHMTFRGDKHLQNIRNLEEIWESIRSLNELGRRFGIDDIFQDNGAKILQQLIYMNLIGLKSREGNDAIDENGIEWELKSANEEKVSGVSTHHHLNLGILEKYRSVPWMFAIYSHIDLKEIYVMTPDLLAPIFIDWERQLNGTKIKNGKLSPKKDSINNPKIPIKFVREHGKKVYPFDVGAVNPAAIAGIWKRRA